MIQSKNQTNCWYKRFDIVDSVPTIVAITRGMMMLLFLSSYCVLMTCCWSMTMSNKDQVKELKIDNWLGSEMRDLGVANEDSKDVN